MKKTSKKGFKGILNSKILLKLLTSRNSLTVSEINMLMGKKVNQTISYLTGKGYINNNGKGYIITTKGKKYIAEKFSTLLKLIK